MMKFLLIPLILLHLNAGAQSKAIVGTWSGILNVGVELRIVFHIEENNKGGFVARADSPDQNAFGIKCDTTNWNGSTLEIHMRSLNASFAGTLMNDSTIKGDFTQGVSIPLVLQKIPGLSSPPQKKRPQTPKPPFPYNTEDLVFHGEETGLDYGATITTPLGNGPFPAAILISGSGPQNRDEEIFEHKPFAVLADHLTRNEFIIMRVDDRGTGQTTGNFSQSTSADFSKDVIEALKFLKTRASVDIKKIGLIGHSEGGLIAPMIAAERKDIDFIVLLAAPGVPVIDLMLKQNELVLQSNGVSTKAIDAYLPLYKNTITTILGQTDSLETAITVKKIISDWALSTNKDLAAQLGLAYEMDREKFVSSMLETMKSPWFRYFMQLDPRLNLEKLKCKVLALNGDRDIQVSSGQNLPAIENSMKKSFSKNYLVKEIQGQNHLFQSCTKCNVAEYAELEETFSPVTLEIISNWLIKNIK